MPIVNDFFGHTIDVAGLVTGGDLIRQLKGRELGERVLIPHTMLRHGEGVFLDDVTLEQASAELGVPVTPIGGSGDELLGRHARHRDIGKGGLQYVKTACCNSGQAERRQVHALQPASRGGGSP